MPSTEFNAPLNIYDTMSSKTSPPSESMALETPDQESTNGVKDVQRPPQPAARHLQGPLWAMLVIGLVFSNFLTSMDNTIVADVQAAVIEDLGDFENFPWISVGFELGAASVQLLWGQLYGLLNKKYLFISAVTIFEVGSVICGSARSLDAFIVGRVICGLGGTGVFTGIMNILSVLTLPSERAQYLSYPGSMWALGAITGPIIGGGISESAAGWRWCFYINLIAGGACLPLFIFLLPSIPTMPDVPLLTRLRRLDVVGGVLWVASLCTLIIAISFGGTLYNWSSGNIIGRFVASGVLWILFGLQQAFAVLCQEEHRLFPVHLLRQRDLCILFAQMSSSISIVFLMLYFVPVYLQFVLGNSPLQAGARLLPFITVLILFLLINGAVMGRTGFYMPWYLGGSMFAILGSALMYALISGNSNVGPIPGALFGYEAILGVGMGAYVQASFSIAQAKVPPNEIPAAVAFIGCAQITGICLCFSIAYSIFINTATSQISTLLPRATMSQIQAAIIGVDSNFLTQLPVNTREAVLGAVADSIKNVWIQTLAVAALSFILAAFMKPERLGLKKK